MDHTGNLYNSLVRYFGALEQIGHYDIRETKNLIIYTFIVNEIFDGKLSEHLDDEGLVILNKVLQCLYKGCLIDPIRDTIKLEDVRAYSGDNRFRYSESVIPRITQQEDVRVIDIDD